MFPVVCRPILPLKTYITSSSAVQVALSKYKRIGISMCFVFTLTPTQFSPIQQPKNKVFVHIYHTHRLVYNKTELERETEGGMWSNVQNVGPPSRLLLSRKQTRSQRGRCENVSSIVSIQHIPESNATK